MSLTWDLGNPLSENDHLIIDALFSRPRRASNDTGGSPIANSQLDTVLTNRNLIAGRRRACWLLDPSYAPSIAGPYVKWDPKLGTLEWSPLTGNALRMYGGTLKFTEEL